MTHFTGNNPAVNPAINQAIDLNSGLGAGVANGMVGLKPGQNLPVDAIANTQDFLQERSFQHFKPQGFDAFIRHVTPDPIPSKWGFYGQQFKQEFWRSYRDGAKRYFKSLKDKPLKAVFVGATSLSLMLMMAGMRRLNKTIILGMVSGLMMYPVMVANKHFPKIENAYNVVKQGNPNKGEDMFRNSLDPSVYTIFHNMLKPITFAGLMSLIISIPAYIKRPRNAFEQGLSRHMHNVGNFQPIKRALSGMDSLLSKVGLTEARRPWAMWDNFNNELVNRGSRIEDRIAKRSRFFNSLLSDSIPAK